MAKQVLGGGAEDAEENKNEVDFEEKLDGT